MAINFPRPMPCLPKVPAASNCRFTDVANRGGCATRQRGSSRCRSWRCAWWRWRRFAADGEKEAFDSTCIDATAEEILTWYAMRWSIEVTFHDAKQHLGFEGHQGWTRRAVERTAPMAKLLYRLIVYWHATEGHGYYRPLPRRWYLAKARESLADMLATLRRRSLRETISAWAPTGPGSEKLIALVERALVLAA